MKFLHKAKANLRNIIVYRSKRQNEGPTKIVYLTPAKAELGSAQLKLVYSFVSWEGMLIRGAVAAIDFNHNVNRNEKVTATGAPMCKIRVCMMIAQ